MPTFVKMGPFGLAGIDYKAQYERERAVRENDSANRRLDEQIEEAAIKHTEIATGLKHVYINNESRYVSEELYKQLKVGDA